LVRTEIDKRRIVEQKLSDIAEDFRLANLDVARLSKQNRENKQKERLANSKAEMRGRDLGRYQAQTNGEPRQLTSSGFTAQYKDNENKSPVSAFEEIRDAAY
jgi:L,D-peptidoglycan transpeptidase YkuD (ErfK/YbiS/YcfS/YnhG family)